MTQTHPCSGNLNTKFQECLFPSLAHVCSLQPPKALSPAQAKFDPPVLLWGASHGELLANTSKSTSGTNKETVQYHKYLLGIQIDCLAAPQLQETQN